MSKQLDEQDDWQPDFNSDSILKKVIVRFTNKAISNNLNKFNQKPTTFEQQSDGESCNQEDNNMMFDLKSIQNNPKQTQTLYDPLKDDKCEQWTRKNIYKEDAYRKPLICPGCFTPVCYNYDNHPHYQGQFYTRDLMNCNTNYEKMIDSNDQTLPDKNLTPENLKSLQNVELDKIRQVLEVQQNNYNVYFSVQCITCSNQIGLYDVDRKLSHLFSII